MNCPAGAADAGGADGVAGIEIVGGSGGNSKGTQATVSGTRFAGGVGGTVAGRVTGGGVTGGGVAGGSGDTHATVAGGGSGGGAGGPEGAFSREPHFSQKLDAAAFCAPHSSQKRTDSEAMAGPRAAQAQAPPTRWM
jgi:hypothetical protein